ncbi:hypothetical protein [Rubrimonas cliftonensis]|uniref:Uncharacterized protein n=1 Tax=Rubrimonas cliftonensis TaxID=89524 RepID=A0A1H4GB39_9RHOB|nr:hypothetical protein [Rubrimonas cliftonensis]SEB06481.1 hypothetical protein SAMN05444370_1466 [Rubrimonas cliftonensis]
MSAADGAGRQRGPGPRCPVSRADLPGWMRDVLDAMEKGRPRRGVAAPPESRWRAVTGVLRDLVAAARRHGLAEEIAEPTVAAMLADARARGVGEASLGTHMSVLRLFARYAGRGVAWADASSGIDMRTARSVLAAPAMRPYRDAAAGLLAEGVRLSDVKLVGRWLALSAEREGAPRERDVEAITGQSEKKARTLAFTLHRLDPTHADLPLLQGWQRTLASETRTRKGLRRPRGPRPREHSVPVDALPAPMQAQLAELAAPGDRRHKPWKPVSVRNAALPLCQVVHEARAVGAPETICPESMQAWLAALKARDVSARSKASMLHTIGIYASRAGLDAEEQDRILREEAFWRKQARGVPKRKERHLAENPLTLVDVAEAARARSEAAPGLPRSDHRRAAWLDAAALALSIARPDRELDFTRYVVGKTLWRTEAGWESDLFSSKTDVEVEGAVWDAVGAYLDDGILLGADPSAFWRLYHEREGAAYFCHADGAPMAPGRVRSAFLRCLGVRSHLMRTLWFDEAAAWGEWGLMAARTLAGHRSVLTAGHYETDVAARARISAMQEQLSVHHDSLHAAHTGARAAAPDKGVA